ncbi:MAG: hypothetical protein OXF68_14905 [Gammaproteobacteria bacterium]|nr:hypothetical protein [Gammaproteobacteria bacterium]
MRSQGLDGPSRQLLVSPLNGGMAAQFAWAVPLVAFLWVTAAWAMGWLP